MICFSKPMMSQLLKTSYGNSMGVELASFGDNEVQLRAPLESIQSVPGVAFNGSIYSLTAICGWATVFKALHEAELTGPIWLTDSSTRHYSRVTSSPLVTCKIDPLHVDPFINSLLSGGKASIAVTGEIYQDSQLAVAHHGDYTAKLIPPSQITG
jgi:thioesterase domain-containing protein